MSRIILGLFSLSISIFANNDCSYGNSIVTPFKIDSEEGLLITSHFVGKQCAFKLPSIIVEESKPWFLCKKINETKLVNGQVSTDFCPLKCESKDIIIRYSEKEKLSYSCK